MFLSAKPKRIFVDFGEHAVLVARASADAAPFTVEEIRECPPGDMAALTEALQALQTKKSPSGLVHATCAVYPAARVMRRVSLETKRLKEPAYLNEMVAQQLHIDPDQFTLALLNPTDGLEYDLLKATLKDAIVCGLPNADIGALQERLLAAGLYPERLELGTVAGVGALVDYLAFTGTKTPVLALEIDAEATHAFIVTPDGVEASRLVAQGLDAMIPVVQAELGLKDAESAKKLFLSNAFDFTGLGPALVKKLLKELQSFIGFYEVQTGQSIGQVVCTLLPAKLGWIEETIAAQLGVSVLRADLPAWLQSRQITLADVLPSNAQDARRLGLFGLMVRHTNDVNATEKTE